MREVQTEGHGKFLGKLAKRAYYSLCSNDDDGGPYIYTTYNGDSIIIFGFRE